jgi:hypothetical protein
MGWGKVLGGYHVGRCMWMIGYGTPPCLAMGHEYNEKVFFIHIPSTIDLEWCIIGCWLTLAHILWEKATYYGKGFCNEVATLPTIFITFEKSPKAKFLGSCIGMSIFTCLVFLVFPSLFGGEGSFETFSSPIQVAYQK